MNQEIGSVSMRGAVAAPLPLKKFFNTHKISIFTDTPNPTIAIRGDGNKREQFISTGRTVEGKSGCLAQFAIARTGRFAGSVPRAVASALHAKPRSLPLAVLICTRI